MKASRLACFVSGGCLAYVIAMAQITSWQGMRPGWLAWLLVPMGTFAFGWLVCAICAAAKRTDQQQEISMCRRFWRSASVGGALNATDD